MQNPTKLQAPVSLSLLQVTDLHWKVGTKDLKAMEKMADPKIIVVDQTKRYLRQLIDSAKERDHPGHLTGLILGGDFFFQGGFTADHVEALSQHLIRPLLKQTKAGGAPLISFILAVPGNHDITDPGRPPKFRPNEFIGHPATPKDDKFHYFRIFTEMLRNEAGPRIPVVTPFDEKVFRVELGIGRKTKVSFWLANSAVKCGSLDPVSQRNREIVEEVLKAADSAGTDKDALVKIKQMLSPLSDSASYDPCYVDQDAKDEYETTLKRDDDDLRVAIMHHNCLPSIQDDVKKHASLALGTFNNYLFHNGFRMVIHGHQHIGETAFYSDAESPVDTPYFSPLERGFFAIGGPAFDPMGPGITDRGFNVITIGSMEDSDFCRIEVEKQVCRGGARFEKKVTRSEIALNRLVDKERGECLRDANRLIYSQRPITALTRGLDDSKYRHNHAALLKEKLGNLHAIRSAFVFSVFDPGRWQGSKLQELLLPMACQKLKIAGRRAALQDPGKPPGFLFSFSQPLMHGIATAASNAPCRSATVTTVMQGTDRHQYYQAADFASRNLGKQEGVVQMSVFGRAILLVPGCDVRLESKKGCLPMASVDLSKEDIRELEESSEFVRICSWSYEDFLKPSSLDIIEFHETAGLPLLWIDRSLLRTREGNLRNRVGYWAVNRCDSSLDDIEYREILHNEHGKPPENGHYTTEEEWGGRTPSLWPLQRKAMGIPENRFVRLGNGDRAFHEFIWLLGHPSLCFAADAWTAAYAGKPFFERFQHSLQQKLDQKVNPREAA